MTMPDVTSTNVKLNSSTLPPGAIPGGDGGWVRPIRDSERARELALRSHAIRRERYEAAIRAGVRDAGPDLPGVGKADALAVVKHIAQRHALHATQPGERGAASSFALIERGWPKPERDHGAGVGGSGLTIHMDAEVAQMLLDRMRRSAEDASE